MTKHTTSTTGGSEEHTPVTDAVLKIIDDERSRYKVALALTAYIAQATVEAERRGEETFRKRLAWLMDKQDEKKLPYEARYVSLDMVVRAPDRKLTDADIAAVTAALTPPTATGGEEK